MEKTMQGLAAAFAGESQANRKYSAYGDYAEEKGFKQAAKLFRAAAAAEAIHALSELKAMGKLSSIEDVLKDAIAGETYEYKTMYPEFAEYAKEEDQAKIQRLFEYAGRAEEVHAELYKKELAALSKEDGPAYYLCPICGYIHEATAPEACPICSAKGSTFQKFD